MCIVAGLRAQSYKEVVEQAMNYTFKDSLTQAEELFKKALKMDPKNARNALLFSNLGTVQKRLGKTDEAIKSYTLGLNITPYATSILLNRAALYLDKGMVDKAYLDYSNVIDLLPENIEARLFRAYIYMNRREFDEARVDYNVVVRKDPKHKSARIGLIMLDQYAGKPRAAHNGLNLLITDYPDDPSLLRMRANLELDENYPDAALEDLKAAIKIDPQNTETICQLGDVYLLLHKKNDAKKAYEKAIDLGVPRSLLVDKLKSCK